MKQRTFMQCATFLVPWSSGMKKYGEEIKGAMNSRWTLVKWRPICGFHASNINDLFPNDVRANIVTCILSQIVFHYGTACAVQETFQSFSSLWPTERSDEIGSCDLTLLISLLKKKVQKNRDTIIHSFNKNYYSQFFPVNKISNNLKNLLNDKWYHYYSKSVGKGGLTACRSGLPGYNHRDRTLQI